VHVLLVVVGRVVVDHQHEVFHVQAARSNPRGDQHIAHIRLEVGDRALAVALVLAAVQAEAGVADLRAGAGTMRRSATLKNGLRQGQATCARAV
jgi:hypothetical protein